MIKGTLCRLCTSLDIPGAIDQLLSKISSHESGPGSDHDSSKSSDTDPSLRLESPWHTTLAAVEESSSSCVLCKVVMKGWQSSREAVVEQAIREAMFDPQDPPPGLNDPVAQIPGYRDAGEITVRIVKSPRLVYDGRENTSSTFLRVECGPAVRASFDVLDTVTAELRITREKSATDSMTKFISHTDLLVSADPMSQESLDIARGWLETCVRVHGENCNPPTAGYMPTRLLEVVPGSNNVYLRDLQALASVGDTRYVALSHCWGQGGTPFTTTHQTLSTRMEGIDIGTLPQTFRDSVVLVERLGLRYLWIDSLCIIQDDADDWARESAQMANVYRNAHLVLNAANSPADKTGFLFPRNIPDVVRLPSSSPNNQPLSLQLLPRERPPRWKGLSTQDNLAGEPVSARAWCLQERYLPVRALQYGTHQAFWDCVCLRASEDGDGNPQEGSYYEHFCQTGNIRNSIFVRPHRESYREEWREVNWVDWYRMIEDYTARSITKHTDRLPALSGLAQAITCETKGEYLAGLWKSGLLEGLLWCKKGAGQALAPTPEYVTPSWSWASVVGPVQFPAFKWYTERASWKNRMADFEPLAEYVSHQTKSKDPDPFGRLEGGHLVLRAPLLSVSSFRERQPKAPVLHSLFGHEPGRSEVMDIAVQLKTASGSIWIEGGFDNPDATVDKSRLSVVLLTRLPHVLEHGFVEHRFGLILERLDDGRQYRRVGFVDGVVLDKSILRAATGRGMFSVVGYPRQYKEGDVDEVERANDLARDPLELDAVEVTIC